ncbi:MAG: signal peptidase I [Oscillospiraceae bacterium]|nr:signal peptidase I [Oscillospiraceae bacterium]
MEETAVKTKISKTKAIKEFYDWAESILFALIGVVAVLTFVVRGTVVDGPSMIPTLENEQFLSFTHIYKSLNYNDIVIAHAKDLPNDNGGIGKNVIKRVIGLPGDTISIDPVEGAVYRNGEKLPTEVVNGVIYEDGHMISDYTRTLRDNMPEFPYSVTVPENHIFVMGDNRNHSRDSRDSEIGMIEMNYVIGKAFLRLTPFKSFGFIN